MTGDAYTTLQGNNQRAASPSTQPAYYTCGTDFVAKPPTHPTSHAHNHLQLYAPSRNPLASVSGITSATTLHIMSITCPLQPACPT